MTTYQIKQQSQEPKGQSPSAPLLDNSVISFFQNKQQYSRLKITKVGKQYEVFVYGHPIRYGHRGPQARLRIVPKEEEPEDVISKKERNLARSRVRAITNIRRYVMHNFPQGKFYTLTFDPKKAVIDLTNISECYTLFLDFIKLLRSRYPEIKYVVVPEFQDTNGRGAVHFHLVINLPFIPFADISALWGHGFLYVRPLKNDVSAALYIAKYFTKAQIDSRFQNVRKYRKSNNVEMPENCYGAKAKRRFAALRSQNYGVTLRRSFYNPHVGFVNHYILEKGQVSK